MIKFYNTPIEVGIRCLAILNKLDDDELFDLQKLVYYEYFLTHIKDLDGSIESLHPDLPYRSGELLIKRDIIKEALQLLCSKELVDVVCNEKGIHYKASLIAKPFLSNFSTEYFIQLNTMVDKLINHMANYDDLSLDQYVKIHIKEWGSEFSKESLFAGEES